MRCSRFAAFNYRILAASTVHQNLPQRAEDRYPHAPSLASSLRVMNTFKHPLQRKLMLPWLQLSWWAHGQPISFQSRPQGHMVAKSFQPSQNRNSKPDVAMPSFEYQVQRVRLNASALHHCLHAKAQTTRPVKSSIFNYLALDRPKSSSDAARNLHHTGHFKREGRDNTRKLKQASVKTGAYRSIQTPHLCTGCGFPGLATSLGPTTLTRCPCLNCAP